MSQATADATEVLYETENIYVGFFDAGSEDIVVSFTSAGGAAHARNLHEFRSSLVKIGLSAIFVADKKLRWFNHDEAVAVFDMVARRVSGYRNAGALGSSMGGSSAILFSNFCRHVSRVLCFAPQFSISPPFIDFDDRYREIGNNIKHYWPTFAASPIKSRCHILFGSAEWKDFIHGAMFAAADFNPFYLRGAPHEVPAYIKTLERQLLPKLIGEFFDFSRDLDPAFLPRFFADGMLELPRRAPRETEEAIWTEKMRNPAPMPEVTERWECLSDDASADQSSIWKHARGMTTSEDASLALRGSLSGEYSFHTDFEQSPWWLSDLKSLCEIHEVRLFNRVDQLAFARLSAKLVFETSSNGLVWNIVFEKKDDFIFGGADGRPLIWRPAAAITTRWLRIRLIQPGYFHLNQVRIYGKKLDRMN